MAGCSIRRQHHLGSDLGQRALTVAQLVIITLVVCLAVALGRLTGMGPASTQAEQWLLRLPVSGYLGWATIATVAGAGTTAEWSGISLSDGATTAAAVVALLILAALGAWIASRVLAATGFVLLPGLGPGGCGGGHAASSRRRCRVIRGVPADRRGSPCGPVDRNVRERYSSGRRPVYRTSVREVWLTNGIEAPDGARLLGLHHQRPLEGDFRPVVRCARGGCRTCRVGTAAWAARHGLDVLLTDAATFPRDKPCGDGLTPRAIAELTHLGLGDWLEGGRSTAACAPRASARRCTCPGRGIATRSRRCRAAGWNSTRVSAKSPWTMAPGPCKALAQST